MLTKSDFIPTPISACIPENALQLHPGPRCFCFLTSRPCDGHSERPTLS